MAFVLFLFYFAREEEYTLRLNGKKDFESEMCHLPT